MSSRRRMITNAGFKVEQIKNLPIGSKIKFSSGRTFVLQAKNASGNTQNTATFVSEFIIEDSAWVGVNYEDSIINEGLMPKYYNELTTLEKSKFVPRGNKHFWLGYPFGGSLGFTDSASRIKKYSNGSPGEYWTDSCYRQEGAYSGEPTLNSDGSTDTKYEASYTGYARCVTTGGYETEHRVFTGRIWYTNHKSPNGISSNTGKTYTVKKFDWAERGVVPFCDINGDAYVKLKAGYWIFVDK